MYIYILALEFVRIVYGFTEGLVYNGIRPFPTGLEGTIRVRTCILCNGCMVGLGVGILAKRDLRVLHSDYEDRLCFAHVSVIMYTLSAI